MLEYSQMSAREHPENRAWAAKIAADRAREFNAEIAELDRQEQNAGLESDGTPRQAIRPASTAERSANDLRPWTFDEMIGQKTTVSLLRRVVANAKARGEPLDHVLLVGASGTGKTVIATVIAHELGVDVYQLQAPIDHEQLLELREVMKDGDVLFVDEIHQQAVQERRGKVASAQPETIYNVMEDRTIATATGMLPFPRITFIGATTDEGMLPDPFLMRFPIHPHIDPYTEDDMEVIGHENARVLGLSMSDQAGKMFAHAARLTPRVMNNYLRNSAMLTDEQCYVDEEIAREVLFDLNRVTEDGLTSDMAGMLRFLYTRARRVTGEGVVSYTASVNTIATALGKGRDTKAVQLRIEPYLIEAGYVQVGSRGRELTDRGIARVRQLLEDDR